MPTHDDCIRTILLHLANISKCCCNAAAMPRCHDDARYPHHCIAVISLYVYIEEPHATHGINLFTVVHLLQYVLV